MSYLHATRTGWSMAPRHRVVTHSKYHTSVKGMTFLACDDGQKMCFSCASPIQGPANLYGPVEKFGECYHCGLKVERY